MNMKIKILVVIICFLLIFSLAACYNEEKEMSKAEEAYNSGNILESLELYNIIYDKGQNKDIKNIIIEIENEIKSAKNMNDFILYLNELMRGELREDKFVTKTDMKYFLDDIKGYIDNIFKTNAKNNSDISKYINQFEKSHEYTSFKIYYDTSRESYQTAAADDILAKLDYQIEAIVAISNSLSRGYIEKIYYYFENNPMPDNYDFD